MKKISSLAFAYLLSFFLLLTIGGVATAQTDAELGDAFIKGMDFMNKGQYAEAVPHLAILVKAMPDQGKLRLMYGVALFDEVQADHGRRGSKETIRRGTRSIERSQAARCR